MSNKEEAWRLEDEQGKRMGSPPGASLMDYSSLMNGSLHGHFVETMRTSMIQTMRESLFRTNTGLQGQMNPAYRIVSGTIDGESLERRIERTAGGRSIHHLATTQLADTQHYQEFQNGYGSISTDVIDSHILNEIHQELDRYLAHNGNSPSYWSFNTATSIALFSSIRRQGIRTSDSRGWLYLGVPVICNPLQERNAIAIGTFEQEIIRRSHLNA